jgi:hypothetical protein
VPGHDQDFVPQNVAPKDLVPDGEAPRGQPAAT